MAYLPQQVGQDPITKALGYLSRQIDQLKKYTFNTTISGSITGVATSANQTNGSQKTQVVSAGGTNIDFATAAKQTDGSQKTQIVDSSGNSLTLSSGEPRYLTVEYTRPSNTNARPAYGAINETVSVIKELLSPTGQQACNLNGGGGIIINGSLASNNTADVGRQFGLLFLRDDISPIIADNSVQTILYANQLKRLMIVYVTLEAQATGSDMVIGRFNLPFEYVCKSDSKALKVVIFDVTGGTTVSGSKYMVTVNVQVNK